MEAAVLALLWGRPRRVLLVRKSCRLPSYWSCDIALPGGHIRRSEDPVSAALREAWEEACVHPGMVRVWGVVGIEYTRVRRIPVWIVAGEPRGPLCPRPCSEEVDAVFWAPLRLAAMPTGRVEHPARGLTVEGYRLAGGVLWGATLRILRRLLEVYGDDGPKM